MKALGTLGVTSYGMLYGIAMRVVLDTSVLVSATRSRRGASFAVLGAIADGIVTALVSSPLFLEYEDVLKRPKQREGSGLTLAEVDALLEELAAIFEPVDVHLRWRPQLRDANDELVFEAAINGRADALITFDTRDFAEAAPRFGVRLMRPSMLLEELRS